MKRNDSMKEQKKIFKSPPSSKGLMKLTKDQLIKVLDDSKIFNHFTREEKLLLCKLSNQLVFNKKGEYVLHEGEKGTSLFILLKGEVVITKNINKSITLATLGPGEIFGEISVFLHRKRNQHHSIGTAFLSLAGFLRWLPCGSPCGFRFQHLNRPSFYLPFFYPPLLSCRFLFLSPIYSPPSHHL